MAAAGAHPLTTGQSDPDAANRLLAQGESPRDPALDPVRHAAWTTLCLTLLNLDETLTKE